VADVVLIAVLIGTELISKPHVEGSIPLEGLLARQDSIISDINPPTTSKSTYNIDGEFTGQTESVATRFEMKGSKESALHDKLPAMSKPSVLLSQMIRAVLYSSLPVLDQGRNWMLDYRFKISLQLKFGAIYYHLYNILNFLMSMFTFL
jgi:hypothetical protein